jgi:hypothetical protein
VGAVAKVPLSITEGTCVADDGMKANTLIPLTEWSNLETLFGKSLAVTSNGPPK